MVSSHCTVTKFLNNTNIIHFLTNSKFLSNYFIFSPWLYKAILHSEHLSLRWKIRPFLSLYSHFLHWIVLQYQPLKISTNEEKKALFTFWLKPCSWIFSLNFVADRFLYILASKCNKKKILTTKAFIYIKNQYYVYQYNKRRPKTIMKTWKETLSFFIKNQTSNILIISNY